MLTGKRDLEWRIEKTNISSKGIICKSAGNREQGIFQTLP